MNIILLTHSRELDKTSNTGTLVRSVLAERARLVVWRRTQPDPWLLERIEQGKVALLYPGKGSQPLAAATAYDSYILLDGTWQEARKMFNRSPYLQGLDKVAITSEKASIFQLRRNQTPGGLCTAESVIELLMAQDEIVLAEQLQQKLQNFIEQHTNR
ncbi:DTW domain-containing protein [Bacterioplanes sanyensis]|uniref:tRNA-uridine aminocarboxypropyltransferase n=1 Tax=Bacterioplanes sanyensis TaxID=1249553 RepID=A0A222FF11_9GAMM|nr:tRNA-uridine aminocarboxypropyltransferase [Bacterioplanes sanyensis]ASP37598.1 DTW domain-containing protein [Bacterioplanes sanyensis]